MVKLQLPQTLRLATLEDAPRQEDIITRIKASANNNIVEGYCLKRSNHLKDPYRFFAEINIDNDRLWSLFSTMMLAMPDFVSLITGHKDDEVGDVFFSNYMDKHLLFNKIGKYQRELTQDGFLQFGVIHQTENYLEEIFIHSAKYIQYWGMDIDQFSKWMDKYSLLEIKNLEFIDSYPMVTTALFTLQSDVFQTEELLNILRADD